MASGECHQAMTIVIPDGYRFVPTDEELVLKYLLKKVKGQPLFFEVVTDREIYGDNDKEPWKLFGETSSEKFYIFTKLKKKGKRVERRAGHGTWKGQKTEPVKDSQNNQVGFKKLFVFEVKDSRSKGANNGHWLMHEFSLIEDESDYVLCAIRNKHAIDVVDDEPQRKRLRFSRSVEEEAHNSSNRAATPVSTLASDEALSYVVTSSSFIEAATPVSTLASDEALRYAGTSNSFIEAAPPASTLASDEALGFGTVSKFIVQEAIPVSTLASDKAVGFAEASNSLTGAATPTSTVVLDQALGTIASNSDDGFTAQEELEDSEKEFNPENFAGELLGAEGLSTLNFDAGFFDRDLPPWEDLLC